MPRNTRESARDSLYSVHPGVAMVQDWIATWPHKTGKTLAEWIQLVQTSGPPTIPLYRHHVFAQLKPSTRTRLDLGLALKDTKPTGRLLDTGGLAKGDRLTHRLPISTRAEIDDEVKHWLKVAYDLDA